MAQRIRAAAMDRPEIVAQITPSPPGPDEPYPYAAPEGSKETPEQDHVNRDAPCRSVRVSHAAGISNRYGGTG